MAAQSVLTERGPETARNLTHTPAFPLFWRIQTLFTVNQTSPRAKKSAFHYLTDRPPQCARRSKDSSVSIVNTLWGLRPTTRSSMPGKGMKFFSYPERPELTQPPIQRILGFYPGDKAAGA